MSEIPEDIEATAEQISVRWLNDTHAGLVDDIARAILAERERCAKIIEDNDEVVSLKTNKRSLKPRTHGNLAGLAFAAAIRTPSTGEET